MEKQAQYFWKRASKDKQRWSLRKKPAQLRVLSTTVTSEPLSMSADKEETGFVVHEQSKQTIAASADKSTVSPWVDITSLMPATAVTMKPEESCGTCAVDSGHDADRSLEESAAIKIQAAIRAYLAWRAFSVLKGVVRLQAHVRGHLVRKQAAGTLRCVQAIVRLQALVRARRVRFSEQGLAIQEKLERIRQQNGSRESELGTKSSDVSVNNGTFLATKLLANGFTRQLLETSPKTDSLHIEYDCDNRNSGWNWLERWMSVSPWESGLSVEPKNSLNYQNRGENAHLPEFEDADPMHNLRKVSNAILDSVLDQTKVQAQNPNFSMKEKLNSTSDFAPEQLDAEDENSMCSLRKVSNLTLDSVSDKLSKQLKQVSNSTSDSIMDKCKVDDESLGFGSRNVSKQSSDSFSDMPEAESENLSADLKKVSNLNLDFVSDQPCTQLRNVSNSSPDSVLDQSRVAPDNPQVILRKISNSTLDSVLDHSEVDVDTAMSCSGKSSNSAFDCVSDRLEREAEKSMPSLRKVSNLTLDSVSGQSSMQLREESNSALDNGLDLLKDNIENSQWSLSKVSNSTMDSVVDQAQSEAENPQCSMGDVSTLTLDFVLDQPKVETENPECSLKNASNSTFGSVSFQVDMETEKFIPNSRKVSSSAFEPVLDQPEAESENHRNILKSSPNTTFDSVSDQLEAEAEKSIGSVIKLSNTTLGSVLDQPCMQLRKVSNATMNSVSNHPKNTSNLIFDSASDQLQPKVEAENPKFSLEKSPNSTFDSLSDQLEAEAEKFMLTSPCESSELDKVLAQKSIVSFADSIPCKHDRLESPIESKSENSPTSLKVAKRRSSFGSKKADQSENDSQGSPYVPNYMAITESAKAKSRAHSSPKSSPDVQEKNSAAKRRHSLPGSHGKQHSGSPRAQRSLSQVQTTVKGNSVLSPRDSTASFAILLDIFFCIGSGSKHAVVGDLQISTKLILCPTDVVLHVATVFVRVLTSACIPLSQKKLLREFYASLFWCIFLHECIFLYIRKGNSARMAEVVSVGRLSLYFREHFSTKPKCAGPFSGWFEPLVHKQVFEFSNAM
eukprot:Gb_16503 [translate_table: standard]